MGRQIALALALSCLWSYLALSLADGTVLELHQKRFFGDQPLWLVPDPTSNSSDAPLGCQNLPEKYSFESGRIYWNATGGRGVCHYVWFFFDKDCQGGGRGIEVAPRPSDPNVTWATQDAAYSRTTYHKVMEGRSVGCSFEIDPCEQYPCEDPNAQCISSSGWSFEDAKGKEWASQVRNCSLCKPGYSLVQGKCHNQEEMCAALKCPAPATCQTAADKSAYCQCPLSYSWNNSTQQCDLAPSKAWISQLNGVRAKASAPSNVALGKKSVDNGSPLVWADSLAALATNWTLYLNSTQCGHDPVLLSKMPNSSYSESDVWISWSSDESSAVQLWAPSPTDNSNPRTARITDPSTRYAGCGKTACGSGAFFTCLFYPKTY